MARITHAPSYLVRNRYSYCFRIRVPQDLQNHLGKKELRYSLATGYLSEAKFKARVAAGLVQILFRELRKLQMKLTEKQIQGIAVDHFKQLVESLTGPKPPLSVDMEPLVAALALKKKLESLSYDKFQIVVDMDTGRYKDVIQLLPDILADHGIDFENVDKEDGSLVQLCRAIMRAKYRAIEHYEASFEGSGVQTDLDILMNRAVDPVRSPERVPKSESKSEPLQAIIDEYWLRKKGGWSGAAVESYDRYSKRLIDHFGGDTPIDSITFKLMEQFRDQLKETGNRGKPVSEKTVNLHLDFYTGIFNHAVQSGRISHNPVRGVKYSDRRNQQSLNDPFCKVDLLKLFQSQEYTNDLFNKSYMFWVPVLLLFTGARLEEICQLYVDDIKFIDNTWVFNIDEAKPDQKVKAHEKRLIPLHPFITEELRLIEYSRSLPASGRLFPELIRTGTKDRKRYGHYVSTHWFPKFKHKCGIVAPTRMKTIHSFRHNVSACLMEHDVEEYVIAMLMGHKHQQISTGRYGKRFEPQMLMEKAVRKLDYGVDLSHLKQSKWVPK